MDFVQTGNAPKAIGPYSQAIKSGAFIFCSGQIPLRADGTLVEGSIEDQTRQVLQNLKALVEAEGSAVQKILKTTVYLSDMANFEAMNKIYAEFFGEHKPARATVGVVKLPKNALVEIDCVAEV